MSAALAVPTFIDTNILVYAHDRSETRRRSIAATLLDELWRRRTGIVSTQVLQEFYRVITRRFDPPMAARQARALVEVYAEWRVVRIDVALILAASRLEERHTVSFWDGLIVEAARRAGARRILSEDLQAGRRFGTVRIEDPFGVAGTDRD